MKLLSLLLTVLLLTGLTLPACAEETAAARCLLLLVWQDDAAHFGCLDDAGGLWRMDLPTAQPLSTAAPLEWLVPVGTALAEGGMTWQADVTSETLCAAVSLIDARQGGLWEEEARGADMGQLYAAAYRYSDAGTEGMLLALGGNIVAEDTDANARALFRLCLDLFPALAEPAAQAGALPAGFTPVPLLAFCGLEEPLPEDAALTVWEQVDGVWTIMEADEEKAEAFLNNADEMMVMGKQSAEHPAEGVVRLSIADVGGEEYLSLLLYQGLLVMDDGLYRLGVQAE